MGQRAIIWLRISKTAHKEGFRVKDFGEIILARMHNEFSSILDRIQIRLYTDGTKVEELHKTAKAVYSERDDRLGGMTDEDVDQFYSCTLCQSYAPNHVCIITPERLGLCGAYTWLDSKASYQINKHGPNEPVEKGECIEPVKGQWRSVNDYIGVKSNGTLSKFNAYSMMEDPMTSCGCFECIAAIVPEANGVMIVDRDFTGMTPVGMTFSTMAGQVGGGLQVPGFIGIGKLYISSGKFISADGGHKRIVWMSKQLKNEIQDRLKERLKKDEIDDLFDKIATEENAEDPDKLLTYLEQISHPALEMDPMF